MKSIMLSGFLILVLFIANAAAGKIREIELKDGSVITGEVQSLSNGVYTIKSDSLGIIKLEESKIRAMRSKAPVASPTSGTGSEVRSLQEKMMSDKEIMTMIESLKDDQDFKKLLQDPEVMKAVQTGDIAALTANPQFMKLLNNPTVKDIQKKVK